MVTRGDIFNSRVSLDALFKPLSTDSATSVDVLIVGHEDGTIDLSMSEDFSIGNFNLHDADPTLSDSRPLLHSSHPRSTTHALLVSNGLEELHVVPFDLRPISSAGRYLSLLASKVTELHNLLGYLHQVQEHISSEIRTSQDLPSRFMRNIDETLREKSDCTWVQAAYHLVVTGQCCPEAKEWLVNELGERVSSLKSDIGDRIALTHCSRAISDGIKQSARATRLFGDSRTKACCPLSKDSVYFSAVSEACLGSNLRMFCLAFLRLS